MNWELAEYVEELVNENIRILLNNGDHCLHRSLFKDNPELIKEFGYPSIISLMLDYELIETETDPDLFYLSAEAFVYEYNYWVFPFPSEELDKISAEEYERQKIKSDYYNTLINENIIVRFLKLVLILTFALILFFSIKPLVIPDHSKPKFNKEDLEKLIENHRPDLDSIHLQRIKRNIPGYQDKKIEFK